MATQVARNIGEKKAGKAAKKKKKQQSDEAFSPRPSSISSKAMGIVNSFVNDIF